MTTWDQAVTRWQLENSGRALSTMKREQYLLNWAAPKLDNKPVQKITAATLLELRGDALRAGWQNRSANYLVSTVCAVLRAAWLWEWRQAPPPRIKPLRLPPPRRRWLTQDEAQQLVLHLPQPVAQMAALSLETGLRLGNVQNLTWDQVDLRARQIHLEASTTKNREPLTIPLSRSAQQLLERLHPANDESGALVFHRNGRRVTSPNGRSWRRAVARLGISDFRWHDLRHTWASWHIQAGTPLAVLKDLGGWKTLAMVLRYAHLETAQSRAAVDHLDVWRDGRT